MMKKFVLVAMVAYLIFCFACSTASAQQGKEDLKAKLAELRNRKSELRIEYEKGLGRIGKEAEERLSVIKRDFRIAREACLKEKHEKAEGLRKDFENNLKPMLKEEQGLVELIGTDAKDDFVKTKRERMPPGLAKEDKMPYGLKKKGKTPSGWSKGEKTGVE